MYPSSYSSHAARQLNKRHHSTGFNRSHPHLAECNYNQDQLIEQVHTTFPWCHVDKVRNVYAAHMYGMYLLRKEEMQQTTGAKCEMMLYHVTTEQRAVESLEYGLDWRRTKRSRFGRGVSFSDDADYADYFADNRTGEVKRVIMICTVLVANTSRIVKPNSGYALTIPPGTADTTMSPNGRVYVKYNDYEFYPLHFVYYRRRLEDLTKSRYFNKNHKNNFNNGKLLPATLAEQQRDEHDEKRRQEQQRQNELLRQQEQQRQNELLRWQEQQRRQEQQRQNELLRRQEQQRWLEQQRRQEQQYNYPVYTHQQENTRKDDWCLIL